MSDRFVEVTIPHACEMRDENGKYFNCTADILLNNEDDESRVEHVKSGNLETTYIFSNNDVTVYRKDYNVILGFSNYYHSTFANKWWWVPCTQEEFENA